ncbi:MAG: acyl-CoA thioesterase [Clostridiales bacterium]|nr:acyl-CoA thioesterase [Clostridiales bacterium]MCC8112936.1 acyl-CoA thioesterase [Bacteroidales bacterium]
MDKVMEIEMPIVVRGYDVDFMQVVNNTVYVKWLEDMRMAILDKYFPLTDMMRDGNAPILAETCIHYKRPINFESHPIGRCRIVLVGKSRWKADFIIYEDDRTYATAQQTGYYFNLASRRPTAFPQEMLDKYLIKE